MIMIYFEKNHQVANGARIAIIRTPITNGIAIDLPNSFFLITLKFGSVIGAVSEVDSLISYLRAAKGIEYELK